MKQVYLVHRSGERLGPYESPGSVDGVCIHGYWYPSVALELLGFRIEEALPEKIEVTREMFDKAWKAVGWSDRQRDTFWPVLCEEAGK